MGRYRLLLVFFCAAYIILSFVIFSQVHLTSEGDRRNDGLTASKERSVLLSRANDSEEVVRFIKRDFDEVRKAYWWTRRNSFSLPGIESCLGDDDYESGLHPRLVRHSRDVFLYSAYYDNREDVHQIRIIAGVNLSKKTDKNLWCVFDTLTHSDDVENFQTSVSFYEMCENHSMKYGGWILSCRVPEAYVNQGRLPCTVTVKSSLGNSLLSILTTSQSGEVQIDFAVCVPPLYGKIRAEDLVQFVELMRLIGANYFVFYVHDINPKVKSVLKYYQSKEIASIFRWSTPSSVKDIWNYGQLISANDCLYRHMATANYISFLNIDEVIIPHVPELSTFTDIVKEIDDKRSTCGISFKSAFFDIAFRENRNYEIGNLSMLDITSRSKYFSEDRNKVIVWPRKIFEVGIHHVSRCWPDSKEYVVEEMPIDTAFVHHYRPCIGTWHTNCVSGVKDRTLVEKYGDRFYRRFVKVKRKLLL